MASVTARSINTSMFPLKHISPRPMINLYRLEQALPVKTYLRTLSCSIAQTSRHLRQCHGPSKPSQPPKHTSLVRSFWGSRPLWRRAGINTFRCLVGCSLGDFSAMWFLQAYHPDIGVGAIMGISSKLSRPSVRPPPQHPNPLPGTKS